MIKRLRAIRARRETLPSAAEPLRDESRRLNTISMRQRLFQSKKTREFLVVGLGRFGTSLARSLVHQGHDVLGIDMDYQRVQTLSSEIPNVIHINAANKAALEEIGAGEFDTGIVCIGTDFESNLMATVLLKQLGVPRVLAKVRTRIQREILLQLGVDEVILPEHEAGIRLARRLSAVGFVDYLELAPGMVLVELMAPHRFHGQSLRTANIRQRYGLTVLAIRRGDHIELNPAAEHIILPDDELLVAGRMDDAERLSA